MPPPCCVSSGLCSAPSCGAASCGSIKTCQQHSTGNEWKACPRTDELVVSSNTAMSCSTGRQVAVVQSGDAWMGPRPDLST